MRKKRVLFVCLGNSCRSQMAEGFARTYGWDIVEASSAGLAAAPGVSSVTQKVMLEKNISLENHFPKGLDEVDVKSLDLIVNMSGYELPGNHPVKTLEWKVRDPMGEREEVHRAVRDEVENLVMSLILELRRGRV